MSCISATSRSLCRVAAWSFVLLACSPAVFGQGRDPVRVSLRSAVQTDDRVVRLADVASIAGGDEGLRRRIADLDVSDPPSPGQSIQLTRTRVGIRLQLAGFSSDQFVMTGARTASVTLRKNRVRDEAVVAAIVDAIAKRLRVASEDLQVRLTRPLGVLAELPDNVRTPELEPVLPSQLRFGSSRVMVAVKQDGDLIQTLAVSADIRVFRTAPTATRAIRSGETISASNTQLRRLPLGDNLLDQLDDAVIGMVASRPLSVGAVITRRDVREAPKAREAPVIKARDPVRLTARRGVLTVILSSAVALQPGGVGDVIRVRNSQSNRVVSGRVVSASEVEVVW